MRTVALSVSEAGGLLARKLPYEWHHGDLASNVRRLWHEVDAFVLFIPIGAAVRIIAPLLGTKEADPAVVCVDDRGEHAVSLLGGHQKGADRISREVAGLIGARPVVTTAATTSSTPPLDALAGYGASGEVASASLRLMEGAPLIISSPQGWPLPAALEHLCAPAAARAGAPEDAVRVAVSDELHPSLEGGPPDVVLHPRSLVLGCGTATDVGGHELEDLLDECLAAAGLARASIAVVATIDRRLGHPAIESLARRLGANLRGYSAAELEAVAVPSPSETVRQAVGTPSVAEAAALLAAGKGSSLVVGKTSSRAATVALARRSRPLGRLRVVGAGPGGAPTRTAAASAALRSAEVLIGYGPYLEACADVIAPGQDIRPYPIGSEAKRCEEALRLARSGRDVALVCSGDPGIYAMASLVLELAATPRFASVSVEVVPGVSAAQAAAALLGAPLGHDHAIISLSDLLTPWRVIEARIEAAAEADMVITLYNPRSSRRTHQLETARQLILHHRDPSTPVGLVTDAYREGERVKLSTLASFDASEASMTTCVVVGCSSTRVLCGRMVTPRGYR